MSTLPDGLHAGPYLLVDYLDDLVSGGAFAAVLSAMDASGDPTVAKVARESGGGTTSTIVLGDPGSVPRHIPAFAFGPPSDRAWGGGSDRSGDIIDVPGHLLRDVLMAEAGLLYGDGGVLLPRFVGLWPLVGHGWADRGPALIMERLDGRRPGSVEDVIAVLEALADAADRGSLPYHGDVKAEHVFIEPSGRVRLCDPAPRFGEVLLRGFTPMYNPRGHTGPAADAAACATLIRHAVPDGAHLWRWCAALLDEDTPPDWAHSHRAALGALRADRERPSDPSLVPRVPELPDRFGAPTVAGIGLVRTVEFRPLWPVGWTRKTQVTLIAPDGAANLIASSEPLPYPLSTEQYALRQFEPMADELAGFHELDRGRTTLSTGEVGEWRLFRWEPPDSLPIVQLQLYVVHGMTGLTATATTTAGYWDANGDVLRELIGSMAVEEPIRPTVTWIGHGDGGDGGRGGT